MARIPEHLRPENPERAFLESVKRRAEVIKEKQSGEYELAEKVHQEYEIAVFRKALAKLPSGEKEV